MFEMNDSISLSLSLSHIVYTLTCKCHQNGAAGGNFESSEMFVHSSWWFDGLEYNCLLRNVSICYRTQIVHSEDQIEKTQSNSMEFTPNRIQNK
jgi:hypothetical protein